MYSLSELKIAAQQRQALANLSLVEQVVLDFLTPEISMQALTQAYQLTAEELRCGLESFLSAETEALWKSRLAPATVLIFLKTSEASKLLAREWMAQAPELQQVKGTFNLADKSFKCADEGWQVALAEWRPRVISRELARAERQLVMLGETLDRYLPVVLVKTSAHEYELKIGQEPTPRGESPWAKMFTKSLQLAVVAGILFSTPALGGEGNEQQAIKAATQAALIQTGLKDDLEKVEQALEEKAKRVAEDSGTIVPAAVLGYGLKFVKDKEVQLKGSLKIVPVDYQVKAGKGDIKLKLGGDDLFSKDSQYWLEGTNGRTEKKIEIGVKFEF